MKFLLTSDGISNKSVEKAFFELLGMPASQAKVAYIPTAANIFPGEKLWMNKDMEWLRDSGMQIDIVDIATLPNKMMQDRLSPVDVLFFEGGSEFYLMDWINKSGLSQLLPKYLKTKVWVGVSAGSMVPGLLLSTASEYLYGEDEGEYHNMAGLGFVDFDILPHLNSEDFPNLKIEEIEKIAKAYKSSLYAIDDGTAIMVNGDKIEVVSEGKWKKFN